MAGKGFGVNGCLLSVALLAGVNTTQTSCCDLTRHLLLATGSLLNVPFLTVAPHRSHTQPLWHFCNQSHFSRVSLSTWQGGKKNTLKFNCGSGERMEKIKIKGALQQRRSRYSPSTVLAPVSVRRFASRPNEKVTRCKGHARPWRN